MWHVIGWYIHRLKLWWHRKQLPTWWVGLYCNACGKNVFKHKGDYFFIRTEVWLEACKKGQVSPNSVLCRKCTERMLGRKIRQDDYYTDEEMEVRKD